MFVVVEGIEGSGKSTLVSGLAARLHAEGKAVVATREPGGTVIGNAIRGLFLDRKFHLDTLTEALLVNAARAQHLKEVIQPALDAGRIVLCDRFVDSTLAYQGYGRRFDLERLREVCEIATGGLAPNLVFLLDLPVAAARLRLCDRPEDTDRIEAEGNDFHERVRRGFLELAKTPKHRILDGARPPENLLAEALAELRDRLPSRVS